MNDKQISIIIGVTGHRDLSNVNIDSFKLIIKQELEKIALKCPNTNIKLLTSLAEGADQLCAEVALELGIKIIVPLPMESGEYIKDFN